MSKEEQNPYDEFIDSLNLSFDNTGKIHIGRHGLMRILQAFNKVASKEVEAETRKQTAEEILESFERNSNAINLKTWFPEELKSKYGIQETEGNEK